MIDVDLYSLSNMSACYSGILGVSIVGLDRKPTRLDLARRAKKVSTNFDRVQGPSCTYFVNFDQR